MKTPSLITNVAKFSAGMAIGCAAVIAIASASASTHQSAPSPTPIRMAPVAADQVVHLDPVTVTMSRARFNALRDQLNNETTVAANEKNRPAKHG
jgi:hypothetical protein